MSLADGKANWHLNIERDIGRRNKTGADIEDDR
jgi:hypothetical protein